MSRRCAIYYAPPPGSELETFGRSWIGRDHLDGNPVEHLAIEGFAPEELETYTAFPRFYGFHATLKAPFALASGATVEALDDAVRAFAAGCRPFACPRLQVSGLSSFIALTLSARCPEMQMLADDCTRAFERFRAPLGDDELERRRAGGLSERQDEHLVRFGYPYVFEDFHFHMTLTGPLGEPEHSRVLEALCALARPITEAPFGVDAIAVYEQPDRATPFTLTRRYPFAAP